MCRLSEPEARLLRRIASADEPINREDLSPEELSLLRSLRQPDRKLIVYANLDNDLSVSPDGRHALELWSQQRREQAREDMRRQQAKREAQQTEKRTARRSWAQVLVEVFLAALLGWLFSLIASPAALIDYLKNLYFLMVGT